MVFGFIPERRSDSFRNECSVSPECPLGRTKEENNSAFDPFGVVLFTAKLIASRKGEGLLPDVQPNGGKQFEGRNPNGIVPEGANDWSATSQMNQRPGPAGRERKAVE
jgi:hypothetical protein